jgi:hypothetical protein
MIYVYAIVDRPEAPLPGELGLRDATLSAVIWRDIAAVVSTLDGARLSKTADEVWRHEEVIESLMRDRAVLPARFGMLLPSRQHVGDFLRQSYHTLAQDIERVRGHVEIGMRFLGTIEQGAEPNQPLTASNGFIPVGTGPGCAHLRARLARKRELQDRQRVKMGLVREAYDLLAGHANASRLDGESDDRQGISAAFLVPHDRIGLFRDVVGEVADANPGLALLCTGPWPPYSFVRAGEGATGWSEECHAT